MGSKKRTVVLAGILVMVLMGLFPPWVQTVNLKGVKIERAGNYSFLFSPPSPDTSTFLENWKNFIGVHLDVSRLLIQWLVVVIMVCGILVFMNHEGSWEHGWKDKVQKIWQWFK